MPSEFLAHWSLDRSTTFLNHGSFGACPKAVLARQAELRDEMERQPVRFMLSLDERLSRVRQELGAFLGAHADDLAFVPNATTGVNTILRSLALGAGDEILLTDHTYNACRNAAEWVAARQGAEVRVVSVPFPLSDPAQVSEAVLGAVSDRTRIVVFDHVTSPTGLVFPLEEILARLNEDGVDSLVDGAHAPGMVPLDLQGLGATYYTGNCHKWLCAPKGAAFLHVRPDRQDRIAPLTISHGLNEPNPAKSSFRRLFDWVGTVDPTPYLAVPEALRTLGSLTDLGWPGVMDSNRRLALAARDILVDALGIEPPAPDSMVGSMVALPMAGAGADAAFRHGYLPAAAQLYEQGFEVPVYGWPDGRSAVIRVSAQLYNSLDDYRDLALALRAVLQNGI